MFVRNCLRSFHSSAAIKHEIDFSEFTEKFLPVYQDEKYVIVNKAPGVDCQDLHKGKKTHKTIDRRGLFTLLKQVDPEIRNIHRIDKWVTGGLIVARDKTTSQRFSRQLQKGGKHGYGFKRRYVAVTKPAELPDANEFLRYTDETKTAGIIETKVDKGESITKFIKGPIFNDLQIFILQLETGRKHQIRTHLSDVLNMPILYDIKYGFEGQRTKDRTIGLHSAFIKTQIGITKQDFYIPIKYDPKDIWKSIVNEEGEFNEEVKSYLMNFEEISNLQPTLTG